MRVGHPLPLLMHGYRMLAIVLIVLNFSLQCEGSGMPFH